eukprot:7958410-Pyramimonas_sp.AAC.6
MNYKAAIGSKIGKYLEGLKPWLAVTLFLLHERSLGAASEWAPYISLLPSTMDMPLFWSEDELREIEGEWYDGLVAVLHVKAPHALIGMPRMHKHSRGLSNLPY